jgi:hypothetical protein
MDQLSDRVHDHDPNYEQDHPNQQIDLLLEFGKRTRRLFRSPRKDGTQQEYDWYKRYKNDDEFVHSGIIANFVTTADRTVMRRMPVTFQEILPECRPRHLDALGAGLSDTPFFLHSTVMRRYP